jgi:hypothetical protein
MHHKNFNVAKRPVQEFADGDASINSGEQLEQKHENSSEVLFGES